MTVIITDDRCSDCGHMWDDHEEDDDGRFCLGNLRDNSTQLPSDSVPPPCPCRKRRP